MVISDVRWSHRFLCTYADTIVSMCLLMLKDCSEELRGKCSKRNLVTAKVQRFLSSTIASEISLDRQRAKSKKRRAKGWK